MMTRYTFTIIASQQHKRIEQAQHSHKTISVEKTVSARLVIKALTQQSHMQVQKGIAVNNSNL